MTRGAFAAKQALRNLADPLVFRFRIQQTGSSRRQAARSNDYTSMHRILLNLLVSGERQTLDPGQNQHGIRNAEFIDGIAIDEIEIETGIENLRDDSISQQLRH